MQRLTIRQNTLLPWKRWLLTHTACLFSLCAHGQETTPKEQPTPAITIPEVAPAHVEEKKVDPPEVLIEAILNKNPGTITAENAGLGTQIPLPETTVQKLPHSLWGKMAREKNVTPILVAAAIDDHQTVAKLMEAGASPWTTTKPGKIHPLAAACHVQAYQAARVLLKEPNSHQFEIVIDLKKQTLTAKANGVEILSAPTSTGTASHPTPTGRFIITEKYGKKKISTLYNANMPFFMRLNMSAVGIHAGELPGYPASKGCIRLPYAKAAELSRLVPRGTTVIIQRGTQP